MTIQDIKKLIESSEYDFLRTNEHLSGKIGMLCLGGSLAYGTNLPGKGDVDVRGFAFEKEEEIIGLTQNFGQVVETNTDTTIYSFSKLTVPNTNSTESALPSMVITHSIPETFKM